MGRATRRDTDNAAASRSGASQGAEQRLDEATVDRDAQEASVERLLDESEDLDTTLPSFDATRSDDDRRRMIAEAAYYIAQRRGFGDGYELDDWLLAEAEVNARLQSPSS